MELEVVRNYFSATATAGDLSTDGSPRGVTLEPPKTFEGQENVPKKTCIPPGRYPIRMGPSPAHGNHIYPRLENPDGSSAVPGRDGILIHSVQKPEDTLGCVGVGVYSVSPEEIHGGFALMPNLVGQLTLAEKRGEPNWITITETTSQPDKEGG